MRSTTTSKPWMGSASSAGLALGLAALALGGCDGTVEGPHGEPKPAAVAPEAAWQARQDGQALVQLTRAVAIALGDSALRLRVLNDLRDSPVREHKLEFSGYLRRASGGVLRARMREAAAVSDSQLDGLLGVAPALEFYMPVARHRRSWTGGAELVVASSIQDGDVPVGFATDGTPVPLSLSGPPPQPVLALVPVETDFSQTVSAAVRNVDDAGGKAIGQFVAIPPALAGVPIQEECPPICGSGGGNIDWSTKAPGLYLTNTWINDLKEGWLMGEPELEVHTIVHVAGTTVAGPIRCVAESLGGDLNFTQNSNFWDGAVLLATPTDLQNAPADEGL